MNRLKRHRTYRKQEHDERNDVGEIKDAVSSESPDRQGEEEQNVYAYYGDHTPDIPRFRDVTGEAPRHGPLVHLREGQCLRGSRSGITHHIQGREHSQQLQAIDQRSDGCS